MTGRTVTVNHSNVFALNSLNRPTVSRGPTNQLASETVMLHIPGEASEESLKLPEGQKQTSKVIISGRKVSRYSES